MLAEEGLVWRKEISKNEWKEEGERMGGREGRGKGGLVGGLARCFTTAYTSVGQTAREKDCWFAGGLPPSPPSAMPLRLPGSQTPSHAVPPKQRQATTTTHSMVFTEPA